jgi:hypothetical protein
MIPDKQGIWEWFELDGTRRLVYVWNVFEKHPNLQPYFRVYFNASYYDVRPDGEDANAIKRFNEAGWSSGTWGKWLGDYNDFDEKDIYGSGV